MKKAHIFFLAIFLFFSIMGCGRVSEKNASPADTSLKTLAGAAISCGEETLYPVEIEPYTYEWNFNFSFSAPETTDLSIHGMYSYFYFAGEDTGTSWFSAENGLFDTDRIERGQTVNTTTQYPVQPDIREEACFLDCTDDNGNRVVLRQSFLLVSDPAKATLGPDYQPLVFKDYSNDRGRDLQILRHDAAFDIRVAKDVWWVPARSLGESSYTNAEVQALLTDTPAEKQAEIDTLYEAIQLFQVGNYLDVNSKMYTTEQGRRWEHHQPGKDAVRMNRGNCSSDSAWLRYILDGDYDEIGFLCMLQADGNGHGLNYIRSGDWYYFIDMMQYEVDSTLSATESGALYDYQSSGGNQPTGWILCNIHKARSPEAFVNYMLSDFTDPPGLIYLYTADYGLPLTTASDSDGITVFYPKVQGVYIRVLYDNPEDTLSYTFIDAPKSVPDWSTTPSWDFAAMH